MWTLRICCATLATALLSAASFGQSVISTHSGVIYYFDGAVYLDNQPLQPDPGRFQNMASGSELRTEQGRAEVLLTPGVFLRVGENASVRMLENDLANTRVELQTGSAIVDSDEPAKGTTVTLVFRDWQVRSAHAGTYRIDSDPPCLWVLKGDAEVSGGTGGKPVKVQEGMNLPFAATLEPEKWTSGPDDSLSEWANGRDQSIVADDSITEQIDNDPLSQIAPDGFDHFPALGVLSLAYADPYANLYGPAYLRQPGFYSMYLPGYAYFPPMMLPLRGGRGIGGLRSLPPIRFASPGVLPGTGGVIVGRPPVVLGLPRPVGGPRPVAPLVPVGPRPGAPVGTAGPAAGPRPGPMPSHPISHPVAAARGHAAASGGHR
jgi:hypothetical protein